MNRTRILLLITDLEVGGVPLHFKDLADGLSRERFDVHVACLAPIGPVGREIEALGLPVYGLGAAGPWDLGVFFRLKRLLGQLRPDILHAALVHANFAGRIVGRFSGISPVVASVHTAERGVAWHHWIERWFHRLSAMTICISPSVRDHVIDRSRVPSERLKVIPSGIRTDVFSQARPLPNEKLGLDPSKTTLIFVGRLDPVKGVDVLLDALKVLGRTDWQLLIVGNGPRRAAWESQAEAANLATAVTFLGMRRDVPALLKSADMLVMPSYWEGFGLSAAEAMAAGLPVIGTQVEGLCDVVEDGLTGILVKPGDSAQLAQAIARLLDDPAARNAMGRAGRDRTTQHFTIERMITDYERTYAALLTDK